MKQFEVKAFTALSLVLALVCTLSCGKKEEQETPSESAPFLVINSVTITPENPFSSTLLQVLIQPQHVGMVTYTYRWMNNGEEIADETESALKSDFFSKGDTIEVEVTPYHNEVGGKPVKSEPVVIANTPPVMRSFTIEPSPAYSKDDLTARLAILDADDDYTRIAYQWKLDDQALSGETDATLAKTAFSKGDTVRCEVRISDDESEEVVFQSSAIDILNSAPLITSQLSGKNMEEYLFEYAVTAEDPDDDPLEFSLASEPEGMTIDVSTGIVQWEARGDQRKGNYEFQVIVSDTEGAQAIQPITLTISPEEDTE
jgi:hypothetical protein